MHHSCLYGPEKNYNAVRSQKQDSPILLKASAVSDWDMTHPDYAVLQELMHCDLSENIYWVNWAPFWQYRGFCAYLLHKEIVVLIGTDLTESMQSSRELYVINNIKCWTMVHSCTVFRLLFWLCCHFAVVIADFHFYESTQTMFLAASYLKIRV